MAPMIAAPKAPSDQSSSKPMATTIAVVPKEPTKLGKKLWSTGSV